MSYNEDRITPHALAMLNHERKVLAFSLKTLKRYRAKIQKPKNPTLVGRYERLLYHIEQKIIRHRQTLRLHHLAWAYLTGRRRCDLERRVRYPVNLGLLQRVVDRYGIPSRWVPVYRWLCEPITIENTR